MAQQIQVQLTKSPEKDKATKEPTGSYWFGAQLVVDGSPVGKPCFITLDNPAETTARAAAFAKAVTAQSGKLPEYKRPKSGGVQLSGHGI